MPKLNNDPGAQRFDADDVVWQYRFAHYTGDRASAALLSNRWAEQLGDHSLHEIAFGAPIEPARFVERLKRNKREILRVINSRETLEAEVAWLEHAIKGDGSRRTPKAA